MKALAEILTEELDELGPVEWAFANLLKISAFGLHDSNRRDLREATLAARARYRELLGKEEFEVNWSLLERFAARPHPHLNVAPNLHEVPESWLQEVFQEARAVQHLCDIARVPEGKADSAHIDARVLLLVRQLHRAQERLAVLSDRHSRISGPSGTFDDYCRECGELWPCASRKVADGTEEVA